MYNDRMGEKLSYAIPFLLALAARLLPGPRTIDDAYITFRYARNILAGNGFVFNTGEPVLGTTTPLYTILLSFLGLFAGGAQAPFPQIAWLVNAAADALTCLLLIYIGRRLGSPAAGWAAALAWAIAPFSVTFAIGGLETSLYVLLLTAMVAAYLSERLTLTAALAALALLTRPDALILIGLLGLDWLWGWLRAPRRKFPWRALLAFSLLALPWLVFATAVFGSPVPHSISAKSLAYRLPPEAALGRLVQHYATPFQESESLGSTGIKVGVVLYPFLFIVGARRGQRGCRRSWVLWVYPWLYFAVFAAANPLIFRWYLTPPLPAYFLGIFLGVEGIAVAIWSSLRFAHRCPIPASFQGQTGNPSQPPYPPSLPNIGERRGVDTGNLDGFGRPSRPKPSKFPYSSPPPLAGERQVVGITANAPAQERGSGSEAGSIRMPGVSGQLLRGFSLALVPLLLLLNAWTLHPDHGADRPAPDMAWYKLELLYRQAAGLLEPRLSTQTVLAAGDVGVLGYYTPARILDTVGLNSPEATRYYPLDPSFYTINYAVAPDLILDEQPDYIVILEVYGRKGLLKEPRFWEDYQLLRKIPTDIYGSDGMLIFEKKPAQ